MYINTTVTQNNVKSQTYEYKLERLRNLSQILVHQTRLDNAISALELGLMPMGVLEKKGIEPIWGGYSNCDFNPHFYPESVSVDASENSLKPDGFNSIEAGNPSLIIDSKYKSQLKERKRGNHPTFEGTFPPEDLLALAVYVKPDDRGEEWNFTPAVRAMKSQKQQLSPEQFVPVFYFCNEYRFEEAWDLHLYVPKWLDVSSQARQMARDLKPFPFSEH